MDADSKVPTPQSKFFNKKIVIIGAGVSGLSAASQLQRLGFKNVLVLEGRNFTGGRVQTVHSGSSFIEIGGQWLHGQEGNCLYKIAHDHGLVNEGCDEYLQHPFKWNNITNKEHLEAFKSTLVKLEEFMDEIGDVETTDLPKSLDTYLSTNFEKYLLEQQDADDIKIMRRACYDWYVKLLFELNGCKNLSDVSCKLLLNYKETEGCQVVELKYGYSELLKVLFKNISEDWIKTNRKVKTIIWDRKSRTDKLDEKMSKLQLSSCDKHPENHAIKILCENGEKYSADHVIVTIPLGCLKESYDSLFVPPLPSSKVKAIQCIGFGALNKIFLEFEKPFWEDKKTIYNMLWINESFHDLLENGSFQKHPEDSWYKFISRFAYVSSSPNMLCAWTVGDGAIFMESLPEEQVLTECHKLLQQQLGRSDIPLPRRIIRSKWMSDPFAHGSYSYLSVRCEDVGITDNEVLASPILRKSDSRPLVLFAGEATNSDHYSTVHGAYETGIREAHRIFDYYRYRGQNGIIYDIPFEQECIPLVFHHQCLNATTLLQNKPKVVIIGAGAAGLSCAQRLHLNGFTDLTVLEAQNRNGGRVHTEHYGDSVLELGAQWVHGEECNPLYEFCESHGLLANPQVEFSVEGKGHFCSSSGFTVDEHLVDEVIMVLEGIKEAMSSHSYPHTRTPQPVTLVFEKGLTNYLSSCSDSPHVVSVKKGIFDWYMRFEVIDNACDKLEEISTLGYAEWTECPGVFHINFKNGFESFVSTLCDYLPSDTIKHAKPVKCIHWKKSIVLNQTAGSSIVGELPLFSSVVVECEDGDVIPADFVIVTPSIGCLKSNLQNFFQPQLPKRKADAIQNSGFGTINKIYLVFDKPFWTEKDLGFQLVWIESEDDFERTCMEQNSWVRGISGFDIVRKQPNTLVGWIGGPEAAQMEKVPLENVGKTCVDIIRRFLNKKDIPYPVHVVRSSWNSNPFIKGSYSSRPQQFFDVGCQVSDLIEPLYCSYTLNSGNIVQWPAVMFAGEATDPEYFSSVHGAMRSGWREADRLIQYFREMTETAYEGSLADTKM